MKNLRTILKAAACSAAGILIMTGCTNYSEMLENEPQEYVSLANENTAKAIVQDSFSEEYKLLDEALKNGSFKLEFEAEGIKFSGECYVNEKDETSSQMYTLTGSKGTSAQIYAFTGKNTMKLGTIGNSGTHIYSFDMDTLADKLAGSIFDPASGSSYAMSEEDYKMFLEYAAELDSAIKGEKSGDDTYSVYQDIINNYIDENPPITSENAEATINGEAVEANIVQYDIPKEGLRSLAEQLIDKAVEQENFYEEYGYTGEEFKSEIMSELDELEDYNIQIVYYINSKTNELMQIDMNLSMADKQNEDSDPDEDYFSAYYNSGAKYDASVSIVYGADPANSEKQSITAEFSTDYYDNSYYEDSTAGFKADIVKSENKTEILLTLKDDSGDITELATITSEKDGENYTVTAKIPELEATAGMTGTIVKDKDSFEMTIDRLFLNYGSTEMAYLPKAVISVKKGGEMLNLDAEKEFLDITEEEFETLLEDIASDFEAVFMEFAEDSTLGKSMLNYIDKSKRSAANAYAKTAFTAISTELVNMDIDGETIGSEIVTGVGNIVEIDGKERDFTDYFGSNFSGYFYAEIDTDRYAVNYALWSEEPIPEKYRYPLSYDEQESLMNEGIYIGCYPLA